MQHFRIGCVSKSNNFDKKTAPSPCFNGIVLSLFLLNMIKKILITEMIYYSCFSLVVDTVFAILDVYLHDIILSK